MARRARLTGAAWLWCAASVGSVGGGGAPILRDRNRSLTDPTLWATEEAEPERYERLYYAVNARGGGVGWGGGGGGGGVGGGVGVWRGRTRRAIHGRCRRGRWRRGRR
jgi:hypothetical protein